MISIDRAGIFWLSARMKYFLCTDFLLLSAQLIIFDYADDNDMDRADDKNWQGDYFWIICTDEKFPMCRPFIIVGTVDYFRTYLSKGLNHTHIIYGLCRLSIIVGVVLVWLNVQSKYTFQYSYIE